MKLMCQYSVEKPMSFEDECLGYVALGFLIAEFIKHIAWLLSGEGVLLVRIGALIGVIGSACAMYWVWNVIDD